MINTNYSTGNTTTNTACLQAYAASNNVQTTQSVQEAATYSPDDTAVILTLSSEARSASVETYGAASSSTLKVGSTGTAVKTLQSNLITLGYLSDKADGIFGTNTKNAVIAFQKAYGLSADGIVGAKTQNAITKALNNHNKGILTQGSRGTAVKTLQTNLIKLGYLSDKADGIFGANTKKAVIAFQKACGLDADGIVGSSTKTAIEKAIKYKNKGILSIGCKGEDVKEIQTALKKLGYLSGKADGVFGISTKKAVTAFQKAQGLSANGRVNNATKKAILKAEKNTSSEKAVNGLSVKGFKLLVAYEIGQGKDGVIYDKNNNIVSIPIMDVGDGKYTVGFGNTIDKNDKATIEEYKKKYGIDVTKVGEQIDIKTCTKIYNDHVNKYTSKVDELLARNNYKATQNEYDALVIAVYNRPALANKGHALDVLLKNNNKNKDDWYKAIMNDYKEGVSSEKWNKYNKGWSNRVKDELELFFEGDYVRDH